MRTFLNKMISTGFFIGYIPLAPGTFGSILGVGLSYILIKFLSYLNPSYSFNCLPLLFLSIWSLYLIISFLSIRYLENNNIFVHDDKKVVIDEIVAQGYTLIFSLLINKGISEIYSILAAFILFRFFDILKPSIIGRVDKEMKNYIGTVLDDILSSIGAIVVILIIKIVLL